jgi:hypothetical protein
MMPTLTVVFLLVLDDDLPQAAKTNNGKTKASVIMALFQDFINFFLLVRVHEQYAQAF